MRTPRFPQLSVREEQRAKWIERELRQFDFDLSNAESSMDFGRAREIERQIDRLENELEALYAFSA